LVSLKKKQIYRLKVQIAIGIVTLFFSMQKLLGQDQWIEVSNPNKISVSPNIFGEKYYKMPEKLLDDINLFGKELKHEIRMPNEKGEEEIFVLTPIPLLSKKLSIKYPNLKTFNGVSKSRPNVQLRISVEPRGVNAWLKTNNGTDFFIQPVKGRKNLHFSYVKTKNDFSTSLFCKTKNAILDQKSRIISSKSNISNNQIRTFRIAIASTGEYTSYWGDDDESNGSNQEDALGAVVSTLNRINLIFEQDLNIRLELVSDASLLFEDASTDPFNGNFDTELQNTLDTEIGDQGYDLGHLFDFGEPNGDAGCVGCVCISGLKGKGFSAHPFTDIFGGEYRNDYFDLDYAGHEIGHQFGAYHTFSYDAEGTGVNAEPGSGSTIMGYAGITGEDDLQQHGDPYFHYYSIRNILDYIDTTSCGINTSIETEIFTIDAGPDYKIPIGTAYELNSSLLKEEGTYTYCWEQLDSAEITSSNFGPNNVSGSMARSLPPSLISKRVIPILERVLANNLTQENPSLNSTWETVPLIGRVLNWGLTVRKKTNSFYQTAQDSIKVTAIATAGPFQINSQNESDYIIKGGAVESIEWDVANTDLSPINLKEVIISMSTDGGSTFPIALADRVPNNGIAKVIIPNDVDSSSVRFKIKAKNGIFFAVNKQDFKVESRDLVLNFDPYIQENCDSNSLRYTFKILRKENFIDPFSLQLNFLPSSLDVKFSEEVYNSSESTGYLDLTGLSNYDPGDYEFNIDAIYGSSSEKFTFSLKQRDVDFSMPIIKSPLNDSQNISINPILAWESNTNVDSVRIQISKNINFNNLLLDEFTSKSQIEIKDLNEASIYYWRIQQINNCNTSDFSEVYSFKTTTISCLDLNAEDLPKNLLDATENGEGITISTINVNFDSVILDVDVLVDLTHTWLDDLSLYLETPSGNQYLLSRNVGGKEDNFTQTFFDQESSTDISNGNAPFTGRFVPVQDISTIYGISSKGLWKLVVLDQYIEDTGSLLEFKLNFCLEGLPEINSDSDSFTDEEDNCPEITNEDQADIDNNGIGDICDIFSSENLSLVKNDITCPKKNNGSVIFNARADYIYKASIIGSNGFQDEITFTNIGYTLNNLAPGNYDICIYSDRFLNFEYCFQTQINDPEELMVRAIFNPEIGILNLEMFGGNSYKVYLNDQPIKTTVKNLLQLPLKNKINRILVETDKICQGTFEEWINLDKQAKVFPNPVRGNANIILPRGLIANLNLFSGSGDIFWTKEVAIENQESILIPMSNIPRGWYILQIDYGNYIETRKLLKE
tara:strand:- start:1244 stop:5089 length:3846 start_codon:yes stop_codon:yes gene_type:complete